MIVPMLCDCRVWSIDISARWGRCGYCRKRPVAIFDMDTLVMLRNAGYEVRCQRIT